MTNRIDHPLLRRAHDAVLLEDQALHATLRHLDEIPLLLGGFAKVRWREVRARLSILRRRQVLAPQHAKLDQATFATSFHPYEVRPPRPPAGHRPRVLHAVGNFYTGGSARLIVDLVEHLSDRFEHVTLVRDNPPQPHYVGLEIHATPEVRKPRNALTLLRRLRPDLVHVHFLGHHGHAYGQADWEWYDCVFRAAAEYGCPVVENVNI